MTRHRRALAILAAAGVALVLSSCGVESGDQGPVSGVSFDTTAPSSTPSTTEGKTTTTDPKLTDQQQEVVDAITKTYVDLGFTEEEASCLAEGMMAAGEGGSTTTDMNAIMDIVNQCDIPMSRFTDIQQNLGGGSTSEVFEKSLATGFQNMGLTDQQAECVAKAYVDEFGTDTSSSSDPGAMQQLFEQCDVNLSDIDPGGN